MGSDQKSAALPIHLDGVINQILLIFHIFFIRGNCVFIKQICFQIGFRVIVGFVVLSAAADKQKHKSQKHTHLFFHATFPPI